MEIDGTAVPGNKNYGLYFARVNVIAGQTNELPYFIWMTELDQAHTVTIASPTTRETVVSTPLLKGLELHLSPNTVITDYDGKVVYQLNITEIPVSRPPFPLPNVVVAFFFTIQPGGAYIKVNGSGPQGARLIYPNAVHAPAGAKFDFWNYDPDQKGWYVYGQGSVSADRKTIVPDPGVVLYSLTGAMVTAPEKFAPSKGPGQCKQPGCKSGEPVDLGTGLFVTDKTDLFLPGVMPIALTRTYRQGDNLSRGFGIGSSHPYDVFAVGDAYTFQDLILSDGGRIHYTRVSSGTGYQDAVYEHTGTQTKFYKSQISWNPSATPTGGWNLKFKDGTVWVFPESNNKTIFTQATNRSSNHVRGASHLGRTFSPH